jgi:hypothetical protein
MRLPQRLIQIPQNIVDLFQSHRKPDQIVADAARFASSSVDQLLMRGRGRMNHQALGIADIRQVRKQLAGFDEAPPGSALP